MPEIRTVVIYAGQELAGKGLEGAFWGDGNVPYLDWGVDYPEM